MKNKITLSLVVVLVLSLFSCKKSTEEMLYGTWQNTNTEVKKIDQISKLLYDYQVEMLQENIDMYTNQLETLDEADKPAYEEIIANYKNQLAVLTLDSVKNNILNNLSAGTYRFNEDSTLVIKIEEDSVVAKWNVDEEQQILKIDIEDNVSSFKISEISKEKLVIIKNNDIDTINFDVVYTFEK